MIVAIHQPNYLPYLGFFDKMLRSDIFVIYDDAQFNKNDFQHRNRIRIFNGWKWLTVPVEKKRLPIKEIRIKNEVKTWKGLSWSEDHFKNIEENYRNSSFFDMYKNDLKKIYEKSYERLVELNMELIRFLMKSFDIDVEIVFSSDLGFTSRSTQKLVEIVEALGGDTYLSGPKGKDYLDVSLFEKKEIKVVFQDFKHPVYKQCYKGFFPNMAAIDALFNIGEIPCMK